MRVWIGGLAVAMLVLGACAKKYEDAALDVAPAPVAMAAPAPAAVDEVAVTGSRMTRTPDVSPREGSGGQRPVQSGTLTAADHDDLLNPELYAAYVSRQLQGDSSQTLPVIDPGRRVTVAVTDADGAPLPFAKVTVARAGRGPLSLATAADGTVALFPGLDGLPDVLDISVRAPDGGRAVEKHLALSGPGKSRQVDVRLDAWAKPVKALDLMLVIDTTGSMGDELAWLKAELTDIVASVQKAHPGVDVRLGLIVYRDTGDEYVVRSVPFTRDLSEFQARLAEQHFAGGGDYPEAMDQALARALDYDWREQATKALLLVADAPPHDANMAATWKAATQARAQRIHLVPLAASGVADKAEYLMRAMAALTQSRYLFLTDDSGVGNPHAEPQVDCYRVTRLDGLVRRVLDALISGRREEASEQEVIRQVGDYHDGVCRGLREAQIEAEERAPQG